MFREEFSNISIEKSTKNSPTAFTMIQSEPEKVCTPLSFFDSLKNTLGAGAGDEIHTQKQPMKTKKVMFTDQS